MLMVDSTVVARTRDRGLVRTYHHHHRLDNYNGGDNNNGNGNGKGFYFFANVLPYTQGAKRYNADNRMQAHMRRLMRQPSWASGPFR